jgi:hypothetical protein
MQLLILLVMLVTTLMRDTKYKLIHRTLQLQDIFLNGNIVYTAGSSANYVSKVRLNDRNLAVATMTDSNYVLLESTKGFNNELLNATTYSTNVVVTAIINNHFYKQLTGI